jgi:hypothetical protein
MRSSQNLDARRVPIPRIGQPGSGLRGNWHPGCVTVRLIMEAHLLALQARMLLWTGLGWLALGLWLGYDPVTVAFRAALGAFVAMWLTGKLLRQVAGVIEEAAASAAAEAQMAAEKAGKDAQVLAMKPRAG